MQGTEDPPDEVLVQRCSDDPNGAAGRAAADALLRRYQSRVYLWCFRIVRDHERALDLAQEVLISAYRGLPGFEGRARFSSWLFAIARHRCLTAVRPLSLVRDEEAEPDAMVHPDPGPEAEIEARESEEGVLELMRDHLDPIEQDALWLRCYEHVSVDDITRVLGLGGASGARGVLQSARRKLRAALERRARAARESR
jgi:RNA polymerase sigma-70 factor (ECF subfamily)